MKDAARQLLVTLAAAAVATASPAQTIPAEFELGYRFVNVTGNEPMYRTQINDRPGLLLRSLHWASAGPLDGVVDFFRVDASDVGAGPAGVLRLAAGQIDLFRLDFRWRRAHLYSALPAFANPFMDEGIVPGQHTYNRTRNVYDVDVRFLPWKAITPILGYTRNVYQGPGTTTYHFGGNDFALDQSVAATDQEYRIGFGFDAGPVQGAVTQGWRKYRWTDTVSLRPGAENGNADFPILGEDVTAEQLSRTTVHETSTPVTNVWITGRPLSRLRLVGSYVRADAGGDTTSEEIAAGNFVSFQIARFFAGLQESIVSRADVDLWRGSVRAEVVLAPNVDFTGAWTHRSRTLSGSALASSLYLDTVTFGGVDEGDLREIVETNTSLERDDTTFEAQVVARALGPFAVNAGWTRLQRDVTFGSELSSVLAAAGVPGRYERAVDTFGGGVAFARSGFTAGVDYRHDDADAPIFRTDFLDRDRFKFRLGWAWNDRVRIGGTWSEVRADNDSLSIGYDTTIREITGDVEVAVVGDLLSVHASGGEFRADRSILVRVPQDFDIVPTVQKELGHTWEGGVRLAWQPLTLDAAHLGMENEGSLPFTVNRTRVRAEYFLTANLGVEVEWLWDKYGEGPAFDQAGVLANFNANRYGLFIHWRP